MERKFSGNTVRFKLNTGYGSTGELRVAENTISGVVGGQGHGARPP
jgi:hypothetical protein